MSIKDNIEELHIVAKGLLEYETLTGDEIKDLSLTDQCVGKYGIAYKQIILNHK